MKTIVLLLLCLCVAVSVSAKVLVITSNTTASLTTQSTNIASAVWSKEQQYLGLTYATVYCRDSVATWAALTSGLYDYAICVNLPGFGNTFDNASTEIPLAGWPRLERYVSPSGPYSSPIPIIMPLGSDMEYDTDGNGAWYTARTGIISRGGLTGTTYKPVCIKSLWGDSLYYDEPYNGRYNKVMLDGSDTTVTWCVPLTWEYNSAREGFGTKNARVWAIKNQTDGRIVAVWFPYADYMENAYMWPILLTAFTEDFVQQDLALLVRGVGMAYNTAPWWGALADTISYANNLKWMKEYCVTTGLKLTLAGISKNMYKNQYETSPGPPAVYGGKLLTNTVQDYANAFPDNIRLINDSYISWGTGDWIVSNDVGTIANAATRIDASLDSLAGRSYNSTAFSSTSLFTYSGYMNGTTGASGKTLSLTDTLYSRGITKYLIHGVNGAFTSMSDPILSPIGARLSTTTAGNHVEFYSSALDFKYSFFTGSNATDSIRTATLNTWYPSGGGTIYWTHLGLALSNLPQYAFGLTAFMPSSSSATPASVVLMGPSYAALNAFTTYGSTFELSAAFISGASKTKYQGVYNGDMLARCDSSKSIWKHVVWQFGNIYTLSQHVATWAGVHGTPAIRPCFADEVRYNRTTGVGWPNSNVRKRT